jgi:hypothetical protein
MSKLKLLIIVAFVVMFASTASADIVPFQWSTSGTFTGNHNGLSFTGVSNQAASTPQSGNLDINLGTFALSQSGFSGDPGGTFSLTVSFFRPDALPGDPNETFSATYDGSWSWGADVYTVDFSSTPRALTFNGTDGTGSFSFAVEDVQVYTAGWFNDPQLSQPTIGQIRNADITAAPVPEPESIVLLCSMLGGVLLAARKKFGKR